MKRKNRALTAAFCIPVAIMLAVMIYKKIYPFGDRCFLRVDMYNQYMPFFTEMRRKLREGGSLFFSWRAGLGANFLALYAYYLASPANWLLIFCPEDSVIEFMTLLIVIKIGLCGLSFAWYLERHFHTDRYAVALFGVCYALSGYTAAYNWNIMWLDCIFLAPVIILGLEELALHGKTTLYCVSLGASILTNYYISIFICIFLVLYYLILILPLPTREKGRSLRDFILYSLLAGGLSGAVLLPGVLALRFTRFDQANFPAKIKCYFNITEILARHCLNVPVELRSGHWPNLYCGAAVFLLLPLYIPLKRVSVWEKLSRLLLLVFFYLGFSVNILEFLWHGMNFPDSLPARQSFLYIFLVLTLCFEVFLHFQEFSGRRIAATLAGGLLFLCFCGRFRGGGDIPAAGLFITGLYLAVYALLLYWYGRGELTGKAAILLLSGMVITETALNTAETSILTTSRSGYLADYQANQRLLDCLEEREGGFYRIEESGRMTKNDGMLAGFPTATFFSSTVNEEMTHLYGRLGMSGSRVFYSYDGATPLTSALLSVNYVLSDSLAFTDDFHQLLNGREGKYLYRSGYTLPLGYMVPSDLEEKWDMDAAGDPAEVQNRLARALGIEETLFEAVQADCRGGEATFTAWESGYYYAYPEKCSTRNITADIGGYEKEYAKVYYPHMLDIGWCNEGTLVKLSRSGKKRNARKELTVSVYRMNTDALTEAIQRLGSSPMQIVSISDTGVCGVVEAARDGVLTTSIPNEAGWSVSVDGRPAQIRAFVGAMVSVDLPAGTHTVNFTYRPPGMYIGLAVSCISGAILLLTWYGRRRRRAPREIRGNLP